MLAASGRVHHEETEGQSDSSLVKTCVVWVVTTCEVSKCTQASGILRPIMIKALAIYELQLNLTLCVWQCTERDVVYKKMWHWYFCFALRRKHYCINTGMKQISPSIGTKRPVYMENNVLLTSDRIFTCRNLLLFIRSYTATTYHSCSFVHIPQQHIIDVHSLIYRNNIS